MSIDQAALMQTVYDTIFSMFVQPPTAGQPSARREILLSLEWPGQQLDAGQYQNPWSPQNATGSQFSTEMLSALIDAIPLMDAIYLDSGVTVEEMYEFLLGAVALPLPPGPTGETPVNPVNTMLANARQIFEQTKMASAMQPTLGYRASFATPGNWADAASAATWTRININSNQTKKLDNSPFVRLGGLKRVQSGGVWKLPNQVVNPQPLPDRRLPIELGPILKLPNGVDRRQSPGNINIGAPVRRLGLLASPELSQLTPASGLLKHLPADVISKISNVSLADQALDQETKDIQISFRCCRVNFTRPWMMKSLLEIGGWTLPGQAPGSLSSGTLDNNSGAFPLLPIGFIAIRDLEIRASWGKVDRQVAAKAAASGDAIGFGPFALSGAYVESGKTYQSSFDGVTIAAPGLQVLGWLNLVMPFAPPKPSV